ncbi:hypothetical protein MIND_01411400 [Mycena indigotica]|uniref:MYND-type domain-containing protein n=1 Tax=Mycena indigotica TaxID=2126181 RepID=A0A8H6RW96_9AGAR|nr:uncharacterized protein MIND_01411400 [Mycena indigotica]KAF7288950.1 hypothetical protein MIND_01411400 [Mycena indigotica]
MSKVPHPDLHLARLDVLPIRPRVLARRVCVRDPPRDTVEAFKTMLGDLSSGSSEATYLLPALYFLLDTASIPPVEQLAELSPALEKAVADWAAYLAFFLAKVDPKPGPAYTATWLRVFPWIEFFGTYGPSLPTTPLGPAFVQAFLSHGAEARVIGLDGINVSFSFLVGQELAAMFNSARIVEETGADDARTIVFAFIDPGKEEGTDEMDVPSFLEGAGGMQRWAAVLGGNLRKIVRKWATPTNSWVTEHMMTCIDAFVVAARTTLSVLEGDEAAYDRFLDGLAAARFPAGLTTALGVLARPCDTADKSIQAFHQETQKEALILLRLFLDVGMSRTLLSCATRGLLPSLAALASANTATLVQDEVQEILNQLLFPELVNPQVVRVLAKDTEFPIDEIPFAALRQRFTAFIAQLKRQTELVALWAEWKQHDCRLCDGVACTTQSAHNGVCSTCHFRAYCSLGCQRSDWTTGRHREMCPEYRESSLDSDERTTPQTRSFLRFLMAEGYSQNYPGPAAGPNIALFDHRQGEHSFQGQYFDALSEAAVLEGILDAGMWADYGARAARDVALGIGWNICLLGKQHYDRPLVFIHRVVRTS